MEEELAIFAIEMQRYKNYYLPWYKEDVEWSINLIYGGRRGVVAAWKRKIENKKRIIVKLQSSLRKLNKKKQALMNNMKKVVEAKEDDDDLKLKREIELLKVKDDIYITRKKAIIKGKSMIRRELELESLSKHKEYIGNPADLPPISDTDIEISDAEYQAYEAKLDDAEPYEEEVKLKWRSPIPVKSAGVPSDKAEKYGVESTSDQDDLSPIDDPEIF